MSKGDRVTQLTEDKVGSNRPSLKDRNLKAVMGLDDGLNLIQNKRWGIGSSIKLSKVEKSNEDNKEMLSPSGLISIPVDWECYDEANIISKRRNGRDTGLAAKGHGMKTRSSNANFKMPLYLEEEISKFIEFGIALGFDFNDKKVRLADIVTKAYSKLRGVKLKVANAQ